MMKMMKDIVQMLISLWKRSKHLLAVNPKNVDYLESNDSEGRNQTFLIHDAGFFSNCSVLLYSYINFPNLKEIETIKSFSLYKKNANEDVFGTYFKSPSESAKHSSKVKWHSFNHSGLYSKLPVSQIKPFIDKYFQFQPIVSDKVQDLIKRYDINPERTLAVYFRGTDKVIENELGDPYQVVKDIQKIDADSYDRILIQSDDSKVRQVFLQLLGEKSFAFQELQVTDGAVGIHFLEESNSKDQLLHFLASVKIISKCAFVFYNTSNVSLWITLFRGHSVGVQQYPPQKLRRKVKLAISNIVIPPGKVFAKFVSRFFAN